MLAWRECGMTRATLKVAHSLLCPPEYNFVVIQKFSFLALLCLTACGGEPISPTADVPATVAALRATQLVRGTAQIGILPTTPTITPLVTPTDIPTPSPVPTLEPTPTTVIATPVSPEEARFQTDVTTWIGTVDSARSELSALSAARDAGSDAWLKRFDAAIAKLELGAKQAGAMKAPDSVKASESAAKSMDTCVQIETTKLKKLRGVLKPGALEPLAQAINGLRACSQAGGGK